MTLIGLGTQDSVGDARSFVEQYGTTFPMLWDETFRTWRMLGVASQPAAVLFSADGKQLGAWQGRIPESEVLRLIGG